MRSIYPCDETEPDLERVYAYPEGPWLRINMVASVDGGTWLKGLSQGLSGAGDRRIFHVLRGMADVIMAGASTVRLEGYGPAKAKESWRDLRAGRTAVPPVAVVTRTLDLDLDGALFTAADPAARTIVLTCEAAPAERRRLAARAADVLVAGDDRVDMALAVRLLRERGLAHVLCEGGAKLNGSLVTAGVVDELCLTVSPLLLGGEASRLLNGPDHPVGLRLAGVLEEEGFLFARYTRGLP
ncbi:hypothetical protein Misp01_28250 [Microtetraspora sp. NBRC 13810]|uniref:pyrimidine reductase family protein n=1 Tax=Microtetraspora sp. NBRC 13810 TaxID=3030990 RepID=UPI0024A3AF83|nr:pyrimidine reductase family protein [Microtetraspora sp. NBRC 13810]GLW07695.1 hypothetical protein Misp01_28250 [Microtetraspora sp. NBRC 13810]